MSSDTPGGLLYSPRYLKHHPGKAHPESPQRLTAILQYLEETKLIKKLVRLTPLPHDPEWIETIHSPAYVRRVKENCEQGATQMDSPDVGVSWDSFEVARLAVDGALTLVDAVMEGQIKRGFGLIRPPGHHAKADAAMGFCLFNNVAIAARYSLLHHRLKRIAIVDWDVHHGNGTQHAFERSPDVLYVSIHQWPLYPGTGRREEKGQGNVVNIPMPPESGDQQYLEEFEGEVVPALVGFRPELILISAGFDAHLNDPLANMQVTERGYRWMTELTVKAAERCSRGRIVSLLEGGYHLSSLAQSVQAHLEAMLAVRTSS